MYILPNQAMELLQITTRQGLHKVVVNHNITVKSQGAGKPNLYLKSDLERYKKDNAKNIEKKKNPQVIEKAEKVKKEKIERKVKSENLKKTIDDKIKGNIIVPKIEVFEELEKEAFLILNDIGLRKFKKLIEYLKLNGLFKSVDNDVVLYYCSAYEDYFEAKIALKENKGITYDQFGKEIVSPYATLKKEAESKMIEYSKNLGIGSRNRLGLDFKEPKKESMFDILKTEESFD